MALVAILSRSEPIPNVLCRLTKLLACSTTGDTLSMPNNFDASLESGTLTSWRDSAGLGLVFFRDSAGLGNCRESSDSFDSWREPDGLDNLRESDGLDVFRESESLDNLREASGLGVFSGPDSLDDLGEADSLDVLKESDVFEIFRESDSLDSLGELSGLDVLKESDILDVFRESDSLDVLSGSVPEVSSLVLLRVLCWSWVMLRGLLLRLDNNGDVEGLSVCNALFI